MSPENSKRKYDSTKRQARALEVQSRIIETARALFIAKGYAGVTIETIAHQAKVAPETIYAVFLNKRTLLSRAVGVAVETDGGPVPALLSSHIGELASERNQHRQIQLFAQRMSLFFSQAAPLVEVMCAAAKTEPDINRLRQKYLADRFHGMGFFIDCLLANGPLQEGLSKLSAVETIWVIASAEVYNLLVGDHGWSGEEYELWLSRSLARLLLP
ncbi:MAG: TetR/AcrR family transcriptional regulator [Anaerolineae bacterium]|nr:TetR/AcrR family transcriptional regulator [Anaerolineae bacterium]